MLRRSALAVVAAVLLTLACSLPAYAESSGSPQDPALSQYVETVPTAGKVVPGGRSSSRRSSSPATRAEAKPALPPRVAEDLARQGRGGSTLKEIATSPRLGAPREALPVATKVKPGSEDASKTFSLATVRSVAGMGIARLAGLLVVIVLVSVALAVAAFSRSAQR